MSRPHVVAQSGFTLVEGTIVLVIIGLLIGSILWGQELLLNGRSKAVIIEMNEIAAAVAAYQDRYQAIPGDDPMAQTRWNWTAVPAAVPSTPITRRLPFPSPSRVSSGGISARPGSLRARRTLPLRRSRHSSPRTSSGASPGSRWARARRPSASSA
jgi:type II secretory pathway pseudopilin PulG